MPRQKCYSICVRSSSAALYTITTDLYLHQKHPDHSQWFWSPSAPECSRINDAVFKKGPLLSDCAKSVGCADRTVSWNVVPGLIQLIWSEALKTVWRCAVMWLLCRKRKLMNLFWKCDKWKCRKQKWSENYRYMKILLKNTFPPLHLRSEIQKSYLVRVILNSRSVSNKNWKLFSNRK